MSGQVIPIACAAEGVGGAVTLAAASQGDGIVISGHALQTDMAWNRKHPTHHAPVCRR